MGNKKKTAKDRHRTTLLDYMSDPDNEILRVGLLSTRVLGFTYVSTIYKHFTPDEIKTIIDEAFVERRKRYAPELSKIDKNLLAICQESTAGAAEIKLAYQRFEGWTEKKELDVKGDLKIIVVDSVPDE